MNLYIYGQLIFNKGPRQFGGGKMPELPVCLVRLLVSLHSFQPLHDHSSLSAMAMVSSCHRLDIFSSIWHNWWLFHHDSFSWLGSPRLHSWFFSLSHDLNISLLSLFVWFPLISLTSYDCRHPGFSPCFFTPILFGTHSAISSHLMAAKASCITDDSKFITPTRPLHWTSDSYIQLSSQHLSVAIYWHLQLNTSKTTPDRPSQTCSIHSCHLCWW